MLHRYMLEIFSQFYPTKPYQSYTNMQLNNIVYNYTYTCVSGVRRITLWGEREDYNTFK